MKQYKKDFPIFSSHPDLIYLDSAATSQKPQSVINAVDVFYKHYNSNIHRGLYKIAEQATAEVEKAREKVAQFVNAEKSEIVFNHGTTEGINILANGLSEYIKEGDDILISEMEHHSNIVPWQRLTKEKKARLLFISVNDDGELSEEIKDENDKVHYSSPGKIENLKIVSLAHVSNVLGTINPVKQIFQTLKNKNKDIITIVDAAQSVPHMKIDVKNLDCDFLVFSGHKMFAPTGVGILYGKKESLDKLDPYVVGSQMIRSVAKKETTYADIPQRFEPGTLPLEGILGLGAAIDYIKSIGIENIRTHEEELISYCLSKLEKISEVKLYGPRYVGKRSGVISFSFGSLHPHDVAQVLGDMNICVRAGHHCAQILHACLNIPATVRASFCIYNTKDDVDVLINGLKKVKQIFK